MAQGSARAYGDGESVETTRNEDSEDAAVWPREEEGRLSNPAQRRLASADIDDLIAAYRGGSTISHLAIAFGVHRTTVAGHLDRRGVPHHSEQRQWDEESLQKAAELYATGVSLADVAHQFGIDAQTVANRFRRAGIPVRPRRGWSSRARSGQNASGRDRAPSARTAKRD